MGGEELGLGYGIVGLRAERQHTRKATMGSERGQGGQKRGDIHIWMGTRLWPGCEIVGLRAERVIVGGAFVGSERGQGGRRGGKVHIWARTRLRLGCEIVGLKVERIIAGGPLWDQSMGKEVGEGVRSIFGWGQGYGLAKGLWVSG